MWYQLPFGTKHGYPSKFAHLMFGSFVRSASLPVMRVTYSPELRRAAARIRACGMIQPQSARRCNVDLFSLLRTACRIVPRVMSIWTPAPSAVTVCVLICMSSALTSPARRRLCSGGASDTHLSIQRDLVGWKQHLCKCVLGML